MSYEQCAFLAVRTDRATGERHAVAVLWLPSECDILRNLYNKFSRYDLVTYMCKQDQAFAILRGDEELPPPVDLRTLGPNATRETHAADDDDELDAEMQRW